MNNDKALAVRGVDTRTVTRKMTKEEAYGIIDALPKKTKIKTVRPLTSKTKAGTVFPFGTLFLVCIFAVLFLFIVLLNVKINEVSAQINSLNYELIELNEQKEEVNAHLTEKNDLTLIRRIATEEYGMVESRKLPSRYVSVASGDSAVVLYTEEERSMSISSLLSAFGNSLYEFAEYLK